MLCWCFLKIRLNYDHLQVLSVKCWSSFLSVDVDDLPSETMSIRPSSLLTQIMPSNWSTITIYPSICQLVVLCLFVHILIKKCSGDACTRGKTTMSTFYQILKDVPGRRQSVKFHQERTPCWRGSSTKSSFRTSDNFVTDSYRPFWNHRRFPLSCVMAIKPDRTTWWLAL